MKKTRLTEEQMVTILREADTKPVLDVAKKHGVSAHTIYSWRGVDGSDGRLAATRASVTRFRTGLEGGRVVSRSVAACR